MNNQVITQNEIEEEFDTSPYPFLRRKTEAFSFLCSTSPFLLDGDSERLAVCVFQDLDGIFHLFEKHASYMWNGRSAWSSWEKTSKEEVEKMIRKLS